MNTRRRVYIRLLAGGYVAFLGIRMIRSVLAEKPENAGLYLAFGAVFVMIGGFLAVRSIIRMAKNDYDESEQNEAEEIEKAEEVEETEKTEEGKETEKNEADES